MTRGMTWEWQEIGDGNESGIGGWLGGSVGWRSAKDSSNDRESIGHGVSSVDAGNGISRGQRWR